VYLEWRAARAATRALDHTGNRRPPGTDFIGGLPAVLKPSWFMNCQAAFAKLAQLHRSDVLWVKSFLNANY
jgi:hypothetical protein